MSGWTHYALGIFLLAHAVFHVVAMFIGVHELHAHSKQHGGRLGRKPYLRYALAALWVIVCVAFLLMDFLSHTQSCH